MADAEQLRLDSERAFRLAGGHGVTRRDGRYRMFANELNDLGWALYREALDVEREAEGARVHQ